MTRLGTDLTQSVTLPLVAIGTVGLRSFDKQAKALAQVEAGIKSTGGAAGFSADQLSAMAAQLQSVSIFGDEDILQKVTSPLLTFTKIQGDVFADAQQNVLDYSSKLNIDLQSAALQVGKALNDPVKGITALGRAGVQFSDDQKQMIKSLVETGKTADAQRIILKELETQFGGSAQAAADAGLGPMQQFKNTMSDMSEQIGEMLLPYLTKLTKWLRGVAQRFNSLDEQTKKNIVKFGLIVGSIGPVLLILGKLSSVAVVLIKGVKVLSTVVRGLGAAMAFLTSPIGLVVAAVTALGALAIYVTKNWTSFKAVFSNIWTTIKNTVAKGMNFVTKQINRVADFLGIDFLKIDSEPIKAQDLIDVPSFKSVGKVFDEVKSDISDFLGFSSSAAASTTSSIDLTPNVPTGLPSAGGSAGSGAGGGIVDQATRSFQGVTDMLDRIPIKMVETTEKITAQLPAMTEPFNRVGEAISNNFQLISGTLSQMFSNAFDSIAEGGKLSLKSLLAPIGALIKQLAVAALTAFVLSTLLGGIGIANIGGKAANFKSIFSGLSGLSFFEGTTRTPSGNLDSNGGFMAKLHRNERVMPERLNKMIGYGVSNAELAMGYLASKSGRGLYNGSASVGNVSAVSSSVVGSAAQQGGAVRFEIHGRTLVGILEQESSLKQAYG